MRSLYSFCITANDSYIRTGCEWDRFELLKKHKTNIIWKNRSLQLFTYTVKPPILYFWDINPQMALNLEHTVHVGIWLGPYHKVHNITEKAKSGNVKSYFVSNYLRNTRINYHDLRKWSHLHNILELFIHIPECELSMFYLLY